MALGKQKGGGGREPICPPLNLPLSNKASMSCQTTIKQNFACVVKEKWIQMSYNNLYHQQVAIVCSTDCTVYYK